MISWWPGSHARFTELGDEPVVCLDGIFPETNPSHALPLPCWLPEMYSVFPVSLPLVVPADITLICCCQMQASEFEALWVVQ